MDRLGADSTPPDWKITVLEMSVLGRTWPEAEGRLWSKVGQKVVNRIADPSTAADPQ